MLVVGLEPAVLVPQCRIGRWKVLPRAPKLAGTGSEAPRELGKATSAADERDDDADDNQEDDEVDHLGGPSSHPCSD